MQFPATTNKTHHNNSPRDLTGTNTSTTTTKQNPKPQPKQKTKPKHNPTQKLHTKNTHNNNHNKNKQKTKNNPKSTTNNQSPPKVINLSSPTTINLQYKKANWEHNMTKAAQMARVSAKGGFHVLWGLVASTVISAVGTIIIANLLGRSQLWVIRNCVSCPKLNRYISRLGNHHSHNKIFSTIQQRKRRQPR